MMTRTVVGIDVSKDTLDVVLLQADQPAQAGRYANTPAGFQKLAQWLKQRRAGQVHACLEATGLYGDEVALFLHEAGHTVSVVNPARIKAYGASQLRRNKTDQLDAALIADYCLKQQPETWTPPDPAWRELRALARHLANLKEMLTQERNRLQAGIPSATVRATLQAHIDFLKQQIASLEAHIQDQIEHHPDLQQQRDLLASIPGIGHLTAAWLLAEMGDLRRFDHVNEAVAFAGLNPCQRTSGSSVHGQTHLSKVGNPAVRHLLYMPAMTARRMNPLIAPWCDHLLRQGKAKMLVIGAAMRKLLVLAYGVLKSGQPFDPHFRQTAS